MKQLDLKHSQTKHSFRAVSFAAVDNTLPKCQVSTPGAKVCIWPSYEFAWAAALCPCCGFFGWIRRKERRLLNQRACRSSSYSVIPTIFNYASLRHAVLQTLLSSMSCYPLLSQCGKFLLLFLLLIIWLKNTVMRKWESSGLIIILQNRTV